MDWSCKSLNIVFHGQKKNRIDAYMYVSSVTSSSPRLAEIFWVVSLWGKLKIKKVKQNFFEWMGSLSCWKDVFSLNACMGSSNLGHSNSQKYIFIVIKIIYKPCRPIPHISVFYILGSKIYLVKECLYGVWYSVLQQTLWNKKTPKNVNI